MKAMAKGIDDFLLTFDRVYDSRIARGAIPSNGLESRTEAS